METSNAVQLIRSFSTVEKREVRRFLASPFFNTRDDLQALFDHLCRAEVPEREQIWTNVCPGQPFDDTAFRLLLSYLNRLLETFLLVRELQEKNLPNRLKLAVAYRNRGLMGHYERHIRAVGRELEQQPLRNAEYFSRLRDYHFEIHLSSVAQKPTETASLRDLARSTDLQYLSRRLQLVCLALAQKNIYQTGEVDPLQQEVIALAERPEWRELPGIAAYLAAYRMLLQPEDDAAYRAFQERLGAASGVFPTDEMREFYMFSVNLAIRRANRGERDMEQEVLRLYRRALEAGYLFENGILSRFTFHNIVAAGLRCGELDWAENFIQDYSPTLERKYRDSSTSFNLARLHYARNRFDSVLSLLQKANYQDPLFNLAAKTLLLKTYYVLGEFDLLWSHLDALRNYIHRKKVIGYHRTNYLNIARYTERLLQLAPADKAARELLRAELEQEAVLTEREWLLGLV